MDLTLESQIPGPSPVSLSSCRQGLPPRTERVRVGWGRTTRGRKTIESQ